MGRSGGAPQFPNFSFLIPNWKKSTVRSRRREDQPAL